MGYNQSFGSSDLTERICGGEKKYLGHALRNSANTEGMGQRHLEGKAYKIGRKLGRNAAF